ncbi:hypothetical protein OJ997_24760 [Solirubrobacter phytolaccae]|uniref:DUF2207 domain-containing protein n=1 Tax=Solirubrobacter phytolaccae TaxID=1404360 RepID=A0A9X3S9M1_9ACTN|nr:hypothetical protein [Solirubrobacter phytolaccae]MDA0183544.1 hypothetical protein [Solirubrobacter phytolaccae]
MVPLILDAATRALAVLAASWVLASPAAAEPVGLIIDQVPEVLKPGTEAHVDAEAHGFARCALVFTSRNAPAEPSTADADGGMDLRWRWTVPADAAPGPLEAEVRCWRTGAMTPSDRQRISMTVDGDPGATGSAVAADTLRVAAARIEPGPKLTEVISVAVGMVTLMLTAVGLWLVLRQMRLTAGEGRRARVSALLDRSQGRETLRNVSRGLRYINGVNDAGDCFDRLLAWDVAVSGESELLERVEPDEPGPRMNDIQVTIEFYEELAAGHNAGTFDRTLTRQLFRSPIVQHMDRYWWLLHSHRDGRSAALRPAPYGRRERLWAWLRRHSLPERWAVTQIGVQRFETTAWAEVEALARFFVAEDDKLEPAARDVWIVVLPTEIKPPSSCRRASLHLSRPFDRLHEIELVLGLDPWTDEPVNEAPPKRVLCIPPWHLPLSDHERCRRLAHAIAAADLQDLLLKVPPPPAPTGSSSTA